MNLVQTRDQEPPASPPEASFRPAQAFGRDTGRYRSFLQALLDGLLQYETTQRGVRYAPEPLPVA
jgi:hypothetical protein